MATTESNGQVGVDVVQSVLGALADQQYDFRTISGISNELGLSSDTVQKALSEVSGQVRASAVPGPDGEQLYAPKDRPVKARERLALAQTVVEKTVS